MVAFEADCRAGRAREFFLSTAAAAATDFLPPIAVLAGQDSDGGQKVSPNRLRIDSDFSNSLLLWRF
jgi:hypothetical protein